jgi:putative MFS transporter
MTVSIAENAQHRSISNIAARLERLPTTAYQKRLFLIIATAWLFDSIDLGALTFLLGSIRTEFGLTLTEAGFLSSASFFGMFLGAALSGMAADRFGRKVIFQLSMIFWGLGSIACGLAPTVLLLAAARILVGFGMGMEFPVAQAIASEITPATHRGRYVALLEGCWPLGFLLAGVVAYFVLPIGGWRMVFILEGVPALWVLIIRRNVPESPRWLADRGRTEEAFDVLADIERRVQHALKGAELPEPQMLTIEPPSRTWGSSFSELWRGRYRRRTVMVWLLWFFALLGYYGLTTWLGALLQQSGFDVTKSVLYTLLISLGGIPGFLVAAVLVEAWGRKPTCITMLLGGAVFCYLYGTATGLPALISFGLAMQFCLFGMWSVLYAYTPELFPTRARATGAGCASAVGRLGSLIGPPLVGVILPWGGQSAVFAFGAAAFVIAAASVLLLGEETKGQTLEIISG